MFELFEQKRRKERYNVELNFNFVKPVKMTRDKDRDVLSASF